MCVCGVLQTRQPWADVVAEPARPTAEQEEWLKAEGFREEPEEQPDEDAEDGAPKVSQQPKVPCRVCCWKGGFRLPIAHRQAIWNPTDGAHDPWARMWASDPLLQIACGWGRLASQALLATSCG